jgi:hypothetical protein
MTNKTVRPIMTVEARDVLDKIHADVKGETRSESIEWFWIRYINLLSQRDFNSSYEHTLLRCISHSDDRKDKAKKEARQWKLVAWSMTAACVALIATMMITAS